MMPNIEIDRRQSVASEFRGDKFIEDEGFLPSDFSGANTPNVSP